LGDEARHDAPQHATERNSAPVRDMTLEAIAPTPQREPEAADAVRQLRDENLNLRIDNRAKELAIAELHRRLNEDRDMVVSATQRVRARHRECRASDRANTDGDIHRDRTGSTGSGTHA
jgi:hypothetical protein